MSKSKLINEIAENCYCSKKDLPEMIMYEIKRMGFSKEEIEEYKREIELYIKTN